MKKRIYSAKKLEGNNTPGKQPLTEKMTTVKFGKEEYNIVNHQDYRILNAEVKKLANNLQQVSQHVKELRRVISEQSQRIQALERGNKNGNTGFY